MDGDNDYERMRQARIANNQKRIQALGIPEMRPSSPVVVPKRQKTRQSQTPGESQDQRKSQRPKKNVCYKELEGTAREFLGGGPRVKRTFVAKVLEGEEAEQVRAAANAALKHPVAARSRGPVDSGKGVRIQGGKVYDSKFGVTCHWCRQKTLEDHVTCCNASCGGGKRLPTSFCKNCLKNRHGEDAQLAYLSGKWNCPLCRGSCGPGCTMCCNCGPCRKKAGLEPTHQIKSQAIAAGFDNVHDYLVHLVTAEPANTVAERKSKFSWGAWLLGRDHTDDLLAPPADAPPTPRTEEALPVPAKRKGSRGAAASNKPSMKQIEPARQEPEKKPSKGKRSAAASSSEPVQKATPPPQEPPRPVGRGKKARVDPAPTVVLDAMPTETHQRAGQGRTRAAATADPKEGPQFDAGKAQDAPSASREEDLPAAATIPLFFPASKAHTDTSAKHTPEAGAGKVNRRARMMQRLGLSSPSQEDDN